MNSTSHHRELRTVVGFTANNWECALAMLRIAGPLHSCGVHFIGGNEIDRVFPERASLADVIVIQRDFPRSSGHYEHIIDMAHSEGKPVIYEIDDLIFELPEDHPDKRSGYYDPSLVPMLRALVEADAVTVSTPALCSYYSSFNPNIWVLPNYLNDHIWKLRPPVAEVAGALSQRRVVIGYMGGASHLPDIELIAPVLQKLGREYGDRIELQFYGGRPPASIEEAPGMCPVHWTPLDPTDYTRFVIQFSQVQCHFFIAPLCDNLFNQCKSPIKFLEYSALGLPGVYSDLTTYKGIVTQAESGFLATTAEQWEYYLRRLIEDQALRIKMGANAQAIVARDWLLSSHAHQWPDVYQHILDSSRAPQPGVANRAIRQMYAWEQRRILSQAASGTSSAVTPAEIWHQEKLDAMFGARLAHAAELGQKVALLETQLRNRDEHIEEVNNLKKQVTLLETQLCSRDEHIEEVNSLKKQMEETEQLLSFIRLQLQQKEILTAAQSAEIDQFRERVIDTEQRKEILATELSGEIDRLQKRVADSAQRESALETQLLRKDAQVAEQSAQLNHFWTDNTVLVQRYTQMEQYCAALTPYAAAQSRLITGLLNGRVMHTMLAAQAWLQKLRYPGRPPILPGLPPAPPQWRADPLPPLAATYTGDQHAGDEKQAAQYKQSLTQLYKSSLLNFTSSGHRIEFQASDTPTVSIIVPLHNRAELTLQCIRSIHGAVSEPFELILVDDVSTDETGDLLDRLSGVKVIRNTKNLHFLRSCNRAAGEARGEYLLFLNSDVQLLPGAIDSAIKTIRSSAENDIGAVGAKIILLDGTLQEAGSIVWSDGSCLGYGRGDIPTAPPYMYTRDVDYCSGAFLLTPRSLFEQVHGFDDAYYPAYYEDTDYCLTLREAGKRILFDPGAVMLHYETASYQEGKSATAIKLQQRNRDILVRKHAGLLKQLHLPDPAHALIASTAQASQRERILFIDDRVPHAFLGSGFPRTKEILLALVDYGYQVTFYPALSADEAWESVYRDVPGTVEVMVGYGLERLEQFLEQRHDYYTSILISRPHNASFLRPILARHPEWFSHTKIVYDAEALYALRDVAQRKLRGEMVPDDEVQDLVNSEISLAAGADAVMCVSDLERNRFVAAGVKRVYTLGHSVEPCPTPSAFGERKGILFVGTIQHDDAPNANAVYWFARFILPLVREQIGTDAKLIVVGQNDSDKVRDLASEAVQFAGAIDDLRPYYNQARIFVAPTRYAAGIPLKVYDAVANGMPVVCTSLLANQLGWQGEVELLVGDAPDTFARQCVRLYTNQALWDKIRANSLNRVAQDCSIAGFRATLRAAIKG